MPKSSVAAAAILAAFGSLHDCASAQSASAPNSSIIAKPSATLVMAVGSSGGSYVFRPVNLDTAKFNASPSIGLRTSIWGNGDEINGSDPSANSAHSSEPAPAGDRIRLLMASVPAGDYAITEAYFGNFDLCLNTSAVVVRIPANKISVVSSGDVSPPVVLGRLSANTDKAKIFDALQKARTNYPNMVGEPANAEIVALIRWPIHHSWLGNRCETSDQFSMIRNSTLDESAARAAALEEAQKNLSRAKPNTITVQSVEKQSPPRTNESQQ